jgi:hypothetical protein
VGAHRAAVSTRHMPHAHTYTHAPHPHPHTPPPHPTPTPTPFPSQHHPTWKSLPSLTPRSEIGNNDASLTSQGQPEGNSRHRGGTVPNRVTGHLAPPFPSLPVLGPRGSVTVVGRRREPLRCASRHQHAFRLDVQSSRKIACMLCQQYHQMKVLGGSLVSVDSHTRTIKAGEHRHTHRYTHRGIHRDIHRDIHRTYTETALSAHA